MPAGTGQGGNAARVFWFGIHLLCLCLVSPCVSGSCYHFFLRHYKHVNVVKTVFCFLFRFQLKFYGASATVIKKI